MKKQKTNQKGNIHQTDYLSQ